MIPSLYLIFRKICRRNLIAKLRCPEGWEFFPGLPYTALQLYAIKVWLNVYVPEERGNEEALQSLTEWDRVIERAIHWHVSKLFWSKVLVYMWLWRLQQSFLKDMFGFFNFWTKYFDLIRDVDYKLNWFENAYCVYNNVFPHMTFDMMSVKTISAVISWHTWSTWSAYLWQVMWLLNKT